MRKPLLVLAFLSLFVFTSYAQDNADAFKPTAGDYTTELNLNLFSNNGGFSLSNNLNQIRFRYFKSQTTAFRLGLNAYFNSNKNGILQHKVTNVGFSINPGIEKHFAGTEKLSPYIGAELALGSSFMNQESTSPNINYKIKNGYGSYDRNTINVVPGASTHIGARALAGVDYYFAKRFYAGIELGYGLTYAKTKEVEVIQYSTTTQTIKAGSNISLNPFVNNGIRIGFVF